MANPTTPSSPGTTGSPVTGSANAQTLAEWAGPYVTNMMGQANAIANQPYQVYGGPLTAGASNLQNKMFEGLGSLSFPSNLGQSFSSPGTYRPPSYGQANPIGVGGPMSPTTGNAAYPGPNPYVNNLGDNKPIYEQPNVTYRPHTEDDWNRVQAMTFYTPGTDMDKEKAKFMASSAPVLDDFMVEPEVDRSPFPMSQPAVYGGDNFKPGATFIPTGQPAPMGQPGQPSNIAQQYMNPYLESVLNPQLAELNRQNSISQNATNAAAAGKGAFGGSRQAIMNAENNRNMMQEMNKTVGQGYATAYDKAMGQFNTEQGQAKTLVDMLGAAGATERGIEQEGVTADLNEFNQQRDYPQKMVQFQQSMLQGLPISTVYNVPQGQTSSQQAVGTLKDTTALLAQLGIKL